MNKKQKYLSVTLLAGLCSLSSASAALYTLSGTLDLPTATFNFGGTISSGPISGTYDDVTQAFDLTVSWTDIFTVGGDATVRLGPATIDPLNTLVLDMTGTEGGSNGTASVSTVLTGAQEADLLGGNFFVLLDADDNDFASAVVVTPIPEPSSSLLLGLAGVGFMMRRKRA